jgi:uncharacterized damage-inducible protein DinB
MHETPQQYTQRILSYSEGKDALAVQSTTAKKLAALTKGLAKSQLRRKPSPDKWSIAQIMAHLADAEVVLGWRLRLVLGSNGISIQAFDQDVWSSTFDYEHSDPRESLESFRTLRAANLALLKRMPKELWNNYGMHQERGKETVAHMVQMIAGHDLNHLRQIEEIARNKAKRAA